MLQFLGSEILQFQGMDTLQSDFLAQKLHLWSKELIVAFLEFYIAPPPKKNYCLFGQETPLTA